MTKHWNLLYPGTDLQMGQASDGILLMKAPKPGDADRTAGDSPIARGDGETHGVDFIGGQTWDLELGVIGSTADAARARTSQLATAWRADPVRSVPGAVAELRAHTGRSLFGRPRRFAPAGDFLDQGYLPVVADFRAVSTLWYGPEWLAEVALIPAESGGFVAPFVFPLSTTGHAERSSLFTVGGDTPTDHLILEVAGGAILNPVLEVVGVARFELALSMAYDGQLQLDGRPWARTTLLNGGSVAGTRSRQSTPLSSFRIPPGQHELVLRGQSAGNPRLRLRGRDAFTTY